MALLPPTLSSLFSMQSMDHVQEVKIPLELDGENCSSSRGLFLTWEDLSVVVSNGKKGSRAILEGLTGYAKPGELLAVMGPSGCGKSTLLDALAGRLDSNTRQSGDILINGHKQTLAYGTSAYVTQDDALITTLTVREAVYYSAQLQLPSSMPKPEKKQRADSVIKEMGLQDAMNTRIGGGWGAKGLSGGQKRRVSICIEILTRPQLLFLDEPTSGLDSAASFYVMRRLAKQRLGKTIVASIHQPSAEVFGLFDNVCLLSSGKTVYFGPATAAIEFFATSGFPCPTLQNPSDHFLKVINKDFDEDIEEQNGKRNHTEEVITILTGSYVKSNYFDYARRLVAEKGKYEGEVLERKKDHANFLAQCNILTRRSFINMFRDPGYYWMRLFVYIVIGFGLGTIFYDVGLSYNSIRARGSMLMFVATFLTMMSIGGFPSFVEEMKVFQRERLNGHYGLSAFVVSNTISALPYLLLVALIPGAIAYFLTNFQEGLGGTKEVIQHYMYFFLVLFVCMVLVESLMMLVASLVPNYLMGIIAGCGIQGLMILAGGFFRLPNDLPAPFWKYPLYYIAFHKYAYQGLYKNEFEGRQFPNFQGGMPQRISGETILKDEWQVDMGYSKWVDLAILIGMVFVYRLMFLIIVKASEKVIPAIRTFMRAVVLSKHDGNIIAHVAEE